MAEHFIKLENNKCALLTKPIPEKEIIDAA